MRVISVAGGTGFIGKRLVNFLAARSDCEVRVLVRHPTDLRQSAVTVVGNILEVESLSRFLVPGGTLINLVNLEHLSVVENIRAAESLLDACVAAGVKHFIYSSTAAVAGRAREDVVNEDTECKPGNQYETTKSSVERILLGRSPADLDVSILRPTAVFGPGGKNLMKLAVDLHQRPQILNYAKSSLQGRRRMNLVHIDNVVAALAFLTDSGPGSGKEIYIVSDDESPNNNYQDVEKCLLACFGIPQYPISPLPISGIVLTLALHLTGRTNTNPHRVYDSSKLSNAGFKKPVTFEDGLADFARWYSSQFKRYGG